MCPCPGLLAKPAEIDKGVAGCYHLSTFYF